MDGSSKGSGKPAPAQAKKKKTEPPAKKEKPQPASSSNHEDPFEVAGVAPNRKAIPCSPKPTKGRLHKVICPMCEAQGFLPKSAIGKQAKCANSDCMVPIFTVPDPKAEDGQRAPSRISDEALAREEKLAKPATPKSPFVMYGVVGGVLLLAALGFVWYLNQPSGQEDELNKPVNIPIVGGNTDTTEDNTDEPDTTGDNTDSTETQTAELKATIDQAVQGIIQASRVQLNNRDKELCRRLSGDALLRLQDSDGAENEFNRLKSNNASKVYYRVEPLLTQYWSAKHSGDDAAAAQFLSRARADAATIPKSGRIALQTAVALAAVLVVEGEVDQASQLIETQQRDNTVSGQLDNMRQGAWFASASALREDGRPGLSPVEVFAWNEPLKTAVAVHLVIHSQWSAGIKWMTAQDAPLTQANIATVIAEEMQQASAPQSASDELLGAISDSDANLKWKIVCILARNSDQADLWTQATEHFNGLPEVQPANLPDLAGIIRNKTPSLDSVTGQVDALADFAITAIVRSESEQATAAVERIGTLLRSEIPSTADVRKALTLVDTSDGVVKKQIAARFGISSDRDINARFRNYRTNLDKLGRVTETRHLYLVQILHRIIRSEGSDALNAALTSEGNSLLPELAVDSLSDLLKHASNANGKTLPALNNPDKSLAVSPSGRIDASEEGRIVPALLTAAKEIQSGNYIVGLRAMDSVRTLPGLRACLVNRMIEQAATKTSDAGSLLSAIESLETEIWQEDGLWIAAKLMTERGMLEDVEQWAGEARLQHTERASLMHGLAMGSMNLLAKLEAETEEK